MNIFLVGLVVIAVCLIMIFIILPAISYISIIPGIENKTKKPLGYSAGDAWRPYPYTDSYIPVGVQQFFWRGLEITGMIMDTYYPGRKKEYLRWVPFYRYSQKVLDASGYTKEMVDGRELFFAWTVRICVWLMCILVLGGICAMFSDMAIHSQL